MFEIKINKSIKLDELDLLYQQLYSHINIGVVVDLVLPRELETKYVGLVPALYQFCNTWLRYEKSCKLLLEVDKPDSKILREIYDNELIFPVVSLVWNKNEVFNRTGETNLSSLLRPLNSEFFDKMKAVEAMKGWTLLLTNFDHLAYERGILPCFELSGQFTSNESKLANSLKRGLKQVLSFSQDAEKIYDYYKNDLNGIIFELMKNTHEWAKDDENKVPLDPNIRGLLVKFYKKTKDKLNSEFKSHYGLSEYFKSDILNTHSKNELFFLEIDIFDSGVGFAKKYKSLNLEEGLKDVDIVKKCMIKHNTSAKGLEKDDKGLGLDRILSILNNRGFLRIKTGKVCLYRNLISHPYRDINGRNSGDMELFDWKKNSSQEYTVFQEAVGTVITIIYPFILPSSNDE
jgi:hypothetical protein